MHVITDMGFQLRITGESAGVKLNKHSLLEPINKSRYNTSMFTNEAADERRIGTRDSRTHTYT